MYIPIDYLVTGGIRKEPTEDFTTSFFSDIYRQALDTIALVIRTNTFRENIEIDALIEKNTLPIYDVQNTIAFTGRRGTGKTSAMISVCNCLLDPEKIKNGFCDERTKSEINSVEFWTIPQMIDASHLDENEDLLEVIIANMLKEICIISESRNFNEREYGQQVEELKKRLTEVQNDYDSLIQTNDHSIPISYKMLLQGADKHHIQSEFKSIIDEYLHILSNCRQKNTVNRSNKKKYLVICIDDIDMYPGNPMQIMQCIYRYFTLPNVLVLTSWNYSMLYQYIFKHYYMRTEIGQKTNEYEYSEREYLCHEQSNDYLRKIIPFNMRIVMPSWKKSDYKELFEKKIRLYSKENFSDFKERFPLLYPGRLYNNLKLMSDKNESEITVKHLIFRLLADRTGIYLDASGYKHHFMEPDGLRSTFELFDTLYMMQNIREYPKGKNKYHDQDNQKKIRQNYKTILDTFYFKLLPSLTLNDKEAGFFNTLYKEKLSRRGKMIIDYYLNLFDKSAMDLATYFSYENTIEEYIINEGEVEIRRDYSIGELFRVIHHSSRLGVFSKDLVKAILASYSLVLPYYFDEGMFEFYQRIERDNKNTEPFASDKFKTLFGIFGGSLLGNWVYELFGLNRLRVSISLKSLVNFKESHFEKTNNTLSVAVCGLLNILMFIRLDVLKEMDKITFTKESEDKYTLMVDLDPTAFLINIIRFEEFKDEICRFIEIDDRIEEVLMIWHDTISNFLNRDYANSGGNTANSSMFRYPIFSFPIHQVDLSYNVIKRSVKEIMYLSDSELRLKSQKNNIDSDHVKNVIERFYQNLVKHLTRVKGCYPIFFTPDSEDDNNIFVKRFVEVGEALDIWKGKNILDSSADPRDVHKYGDYKINLMISNYCTFTTVDMKEDLDTLGEYDLNHIIKEITKLKSSETSSKIINKKSKSKK